MTLLRHAFPEQFWGEHYAAGGAFGRRCLTNYGRNADRTANPEFVVSEHSTRLEEDAASIVERDARRAKVAIVALRRLIRNADQPR